MPVLIGIRLAPIVLVNYRRNSVNGLVGVRVLASLLWAQL